MLINIVFSSKVIANVFSIIKSIELSLNEPNSDIDLNVFVFDKTPEQDVLSKMYGSKLNITVISLTEIYKLEEQYLSLFEKANCSRKHDSIQRARIQQQIYILENISLFKDSIVWQVDDDMLFAKSNFSNNNHEIENSNKIFSDLVEFYKSNSNVDAIIAPSTYVPPIPSLLYCETQLNDIFNLTFSKESSEILEYHDFYNQNKNNSFYSILIDEGKGKNELVKNILIGMPVTKVSHGISNPINLNSNLLRGGNFIVFNTDIFSIPHLGFIENQEIPARRSDMIHARLVDELGYEIIDNSEFSLVHNRNFENIKFEDCVKDYFSDMIGSLLTQYVYKGESYFKERLQFHQNHIKRILNLLFENVDINEIKDEILALEKLHNQINQLDKQHFISQFESFKAHKEQLKNNLCKLVS